MKVSHDPWTRFQLYHTGSDIYLQDADKQIDARQSFQHIIALLSTAMIHKATTGKASTIRCERQQKWGTISIIEYTKKHVVIAEDTEAAIYAFQSVNISQICARKLLKLKTGCTS